jgi:esterase
MKAGIIALIAIVTVVAPAAQSPPARVVANGAELHYIQQGEGEPVILLHGGQADYRSWPSLLDALAPRYRAIAYSRRYHFPNTNPITSDHSAIVDADDLSGLVTALGLGRVHLVGTSYGAFTALAFAIKHPQLVRSLVLAEPPVHQWVTDAPAGAALYQQFLAKVHQPAVKAFADGHDEVAMRVFVDAFDGPGAFDGLPAERRANIMANAQFFKALARSADPYPNLSKADARNLRMPVLLIRGANSDALHTAVLEEIGRVIPSASRVVIPNAGHGSPRQNPAAFNAAVLDFLRSAQR